MYAFEYHRPTSVKEAAGLASQAEDTKFLAGGHTLLPTMKLRLAGPSNLIDLGQIAELRGIERSGDTITIGAMMKHAEVANSA
ncbi:MAG: carbon monoxide dehydrogenase, partial [Microvirga sp.]|nr:carbon monoxide dehydrogenase [Microvirga sp.]